MKTIYGLSALMLFIQLNFTGCKKFVEVDAPGNQLIGTKVFSADATAISYMNGLYISMSENGETGLGGNFGLANRLGLAADELNLWANSFDTGLQTFYTNTQTSSEGTGYWASMYNRISFINKALEGLDETTSLTPAIKEQLLGEAYFMRGFYYFYLVNLYGEVPLLLTTDYQTNRLAARADISEVYAQIESDLNIADSKLSNNFLGANLLTPSSDRVRPTKWAAQSLLARVFLFEKKWAQAETAATKVISNTGNFSLENDLNSVFLNTSKEAIWQLMPVDPNVNTFDAQIFVLLNGLDFSHQVYLSQSLVNSFQMNDKRKLNWIKTDNTSSSPLNYAFKYKKVTGQPWTEYLMVFRLAELYLIRAEARTEQNNLTGAKSDLDMIRLRAGLAPSLALSQSDFRTAILDERRHELFTEMGHRWLDIKRTGRIDQVMTAASSEKGNTWETHQQWLPIPIGELQKDPNLEQTAGY